MAFRSILTSGAAAPFLPTFSEWPIFPDCPLEDIPLFSVFILIFIVFLKALDRQFVPRGKEQHDLGSIRCSKQTP